MVLKDTLVRSVASQDNETVAAVAVHGFEYGELTRLALDSISVAGSKAGAYVT